MNQNDKMIVGCCGATVLLSFFSWYSVSVGGQAAEMVKAFGGSLPSVNAFDRAWGVLGFLGVAAAGGLVLADDAGKLPWEANVRRTAPFGAAAVGAVFILLFMTGLGSGGAMGMNAGMTFWYYLALAGAGGAAWFGFQRMQVEAAGSDPVTEAPTEEAPE